jgi:hypothetical protein
VFDVVDDVGYSDFDRRPRDPNGVNEQIHPMLLLGEHMLDTRANFRFRIIGSPNRLGHGAALRLLAMDVADEPVPYQECLIDRRSIGGLGPQPARRIGIVKQADRLQLSGPSVMLVEKRSLH